MPRVLSFDVPPGKVVRRGNDHFWAVILELNQAGAWSVADIKHRSGAVDRSTIRDFVKRLVAGGFARVADVECDHPHYLLLKTQLATPSLRRDGTPGLQGRGQTAMWNVIRGPIGRGSFTYQDLALFASTQTAVVTQVSAKSYIKHLHRAGFLLCVRKGKVRTPAQWRARPNLGKLPPLVLRGHIVFDQNTGAAVGPVTAVEVEP